MKRLLCHAVVLLTSLGLSWVPGTPATAGGKFNPGAFSAQKFSGNAGNSNSSARRPSAKLQMNSNWSKGLATPKLASPALNKASNLKNYGQTLPKSGGLKLNHPSLGQFKTAKPTLPKNNGSNVGKLNPGTFNGNLGGLKPAQPITRFPKPSIGTGLNPGLIGDTKLPTFPTGPIKQPPVVKPPFGPGIVKPPIVKPPVAQPPVVKPPFGPGIVKPPIVKPPIVKPPFDPPIVKPPFNPPIVKPPFDPPIVKPPFDPPIVKPPFDPPIKQPPICPPFDPPVCKPCPPKHWPPICWPPIVRPCPPIYCPPVCDYPICPPQVVLPPVIVQTGVRIVERQVAVPAEVMAAHRGLELIDLRWVDLGDPQKNLGPRFRMYLRNASTTATYAAFDAALVATVGSQLNADAPRAVESVPALQPQQTAAVDLRLPVEAMQMAAAGGRAGMFQNLYVLVGEADGTVRQLAVMPRDKIGLVDLALLDNGTLAARPGQSLTLLGEGFGLEEGRVLLSLEGQTYAVPVDQWTALGVQVRLPDMQLASATTASIQVVRADGQKAMAEMTLAPQTAAASSEAPVVEFSLK